MQSRLKSYLCRPAEIWCYEQAFIRDQCFITETDEQINSEVFIEQKIHKQVILIKVFNIAKKFHNHST